MMEERHTVMFVDNFLALMSFTNSGSLTHIISTCFALLMFCSFRRWLSSGCRIREEKFQ